MTQNQDTRREIEELVKARNSDELEKRMRCCAVSALWEIHEYLVR